MKIKDASGFSLLLFVATVAAGAASVTAAEIVASPAKRQQTLDNSKKLMAPRELVPVVANPFYTDSFGAEVPDTRTNTDPSPGPLNDRERLKAIALSLKPTGFFVIGDQPTLVFGQKKVKAGSLLTITFEGAEYTLEVASIDRTNFTLRLNREEFTRPNK